MIRIVYKHVFGIFFFFKIFATPQFLVKNRSKQWKSACPSTRISVNRLGWTGIFLIFFTFSQFFGFYFYSKAIMDPYYSFLMSFLHSLMFRIGFGADISIFEPNLAPQSSYFHRKVIQILKTNGIRNIMILELNGVKNTENRYLT